VAVSNFGFIELTRYETESGFSISIFEHPELEIGMASVFQQKL